MSSRIVSTELVEQVKSLAAQFLSASQIAREIGDGRTRNSIIGICSRRGIALGGYSGGRADVMMPKKKRGDQGGGAVRRLQSKAATPNQPVLIPFVLRPKRIPVHPVMPLEPITLAELDMATQCRFPIGEPTKTEPQQYCGAERQWPGEGSEHVYCIVHARLSYNPGVRR